MLNFHVRRVYQSRSLEIVVTLPEELRKQPDQLGHLPMQCIWNLDNTGDVATIRQTEGRYNILHRNGKRLQTVTTNVDDVDFNAWTQDLQQRLAQQLLLSTDMHLQLTGAAIEQSESKQQLLIHSLLAGAGVLLLIYLAIGNGRQVFITLLNVPFALVGGILAALFTNMPISIGCMVGFVNLLLLPSILYRFGRHS